MKPKEHARRIAQRLQDDGYSYAEARRLAGQIVAKQNPHTTKPQ